MEIDYEDTGMDGGSRDGRGKQGWKGEAGVGSSTQGRTWSWTEKSPSPQHRAEEADRGADGSGFSVEQGKAGWE